MLLLITAQLVLWALVIASCIYVPIGIMLICGVIKVRGSLSLVLFHTVTKIKKLLTYNIVTYGIIKCEPKVLAKLCH